MTFIRPVVGKTALLRQKLQHYRRIATTLGKAYQTYLL